MKLSRAQRAKVRSLMADSGYSRREAVAWVEAFEPDDAQTRPTVKVPARTCAEEVRVAPLSDLRLKLGRDLDELAALSPEDLTAASGVKVFPRPANGGGR